MTATLPRHGAVAAVGPSTAPAVGGSGRVESAERAVQGVSRARVAADWGRLESFRPSYPFWQHIFRIPDGRIAFGSALDGRLLASFPTRGDWKRDAVWEDPTLAEALDRQSLSRSLSRRRDQVETLLEPVTGPLVHNPTRGQFLMPNAERYGTFLDEWGGIYERFGVPAELGLAQAVLESGLNGRARSRASALGFCQWLSPNWAHLNRLSPHVLEAYNQTTQAPYCAAYLSILGTMYGSFIPALSEHHTGGVNVGRVLINGERLGGADAPEQYLLGSEFAVRLRDISIRRYRALFRTYGQRSYRYAEMVFGNTVNVTKLIAEHPQERVFAMRAPRAIPLEEVTRTTGLSVDEVKRFNPALVRRVPARANVYLPRYVEEFGPNVSFWHEAPTGEFVLLLHEFLQLESGVLQWQEESFEATLQGFQRRFKETDSEEGSVMATTLAYVMDNLRRSRRSAILEEFRTSSRILQLFRRGVQELGPAVPGL